MPIPKCLRISQDQVLDLISQIYDAGLDANRWGDTLEKFTTAVQAQESILRIIDVKRKGIVRYYHHNKDPHWLKAYGDHFIKIDPYMALLHQSTKPVIDCTQHLIPDREIRKIPFYHEYLAPTNTHYGAGGLIEVNAASKIYLTFQRSFNKGGFTNEHLKLFKILVPHINKSILIGNRTRQLALEAETLKNSLSLINRAILLVNRRGETLFANCAAEELVSKHQGLALTPQGLTLSVRSEHRRLQETIFNATTKRSNDSIPTAGGMKYHYPGNENWMSILVSPLNPETVDFDFETTRCALIFLSENRPDPGINPGIVSEIYKLTSAEAKITVLLCQGMTLNQIAEQLRISSNTARTHLKAIFDKTDTSRQAELISLVNTGPAGFKYTD